MTDPKPKPKGGARKGAGRKPGVPNKRTQELMEKARRMGDTPVEWLLRQMRNAKRDLGFRFDCAVAAAPYVHAKLSASTQTSIDIDVKQLSDEQLRRMAELAGSLEECLAPDHGRAAAPGDDGSDKGPATRH